MKEPALYTRSIALAGLPQFLESLNGDPTKLFKKAGLDLAIANNTQSFVSWNKFCNLLEIAAHDLGEPSLGIKWADHLPKDFLNSGPMLYLATMTSTIRDFVEMGNAYQKIHTNGLKYTFTENAKTDMLECRIITHSHSAPCRQILEHIMAIGVIMSRHYVKGPAFRLLQFQHSPPKDMTWHEKIFDFPTEFNCDETLCLMEREILDVKIGGKLKILKPILNFHLSLEIKKKPTYHQSMLAMVREILPTIIGVGNSSFSNVAEVLEINPKKLQRLLNQEGCTYSAILDDVRHNMAKRMLYETDVPIKRIARLLDYKSGEAFNTACHRWVQISPKTYREKLRQSKWTDNS